MGTDLALIAEGGGMRASYTFGALKALDQVFNDQNGLSNFSYMAATSASSVSLMYAIAEQLYSQLENIWINKVQDRRFFNIYDIRRLMMGPPILDINYLVDTVLKNEAALDLQKILNTSTKFYIPLLDVKDLSIKYYTNDEDVAESMYSFGLIHLDKENIGEIYQVLKAACATPLLFNHEVEVQGRMYVSGSLLAPLPLAAPIPNVCKRVVLLNRTEASPAGWFRDKILPSIAKGGFFHGQISNTQVYELMMQEERYYNAQFDEYLDQDNCFVIKPTRIISASNNRASSLYRNIEEGYRDVIARKDEFQDFLNA